jgi:hypothetical protein
MELQQVRSSSKAQEERNNMSDLKALGFIRENRDRWVKRDHIGDATGLFNGDTCEALGPSLARLEWRKLILTRLDLDGYPEFTAV